MEFLAFSDKKKISKKIMYTLNSFEDTMPKSNNLHALINNEGCRSLN